MSESTRRILKDYARNLLNEGYKIASAIYNCPKGARRDFLNIQLNGIRAELKTLKEFTKEQKLRDYQNGQIAHRFAGEPKLRSKSLVWITILFYLAMLGG